MSHIVCQRCHQARATVHITDTTPKKRELHLCEDCAEKEGVIVKQHHTTNQVLQEFIKQKTGPHKLDDVACPKCGITFREFQMSGQLGCPHDYVAFREVLTPLIERAHENATQHVGKVPRTAGSTVQRHADMLRLRRELEQAVKAENYELAARVRDEIRALEVAESPES